jgi:hypothetical protein
MTHGYFLGFEPTEWYSANVGYSVKSNPYPPDWQSESAVSVICRNVTLFVLGNNGHEHFVACFC